MIKKVVKKGRLQDLSDAVCSQEQRRARFQPRWGGGKKQLKVNEVGVDLVVGDCKCLRRLIGPERNRLWR